VKLPRMLDAAPTASASVRRAPLLSLAVAEHFDQCCA
jgi:hypothetical protein